MDFKYTASHRKTGQKVNGMASAANVADLVMRLKTDDLIPLNIRSAETPGSRSRLRMPWFGAKVTGKELAVFTRQLAATLSAGLLLTEALETIADDLENKYFGQIIADIRDRIQSGSDFSSALERYPKIFPVTYTSIVQSGEATGNLHVTMASLAKYLEASERLKEKVKGAIRYPLFVLSFAVFVLLVIVFFLIPKFQGMFASSGADLPLLTRMVVGFSEWCIQYSPLVLVGTVMAWCGFVYSLRFDRFHHFIDRMKLKIPVLGKEVIHKSIISRYCRTLGFLLEGGVGLSKALEITALAVDHMPMGQAIEALRGRVISGSSISDEMKRHRIFPRLAAKMTAVGERSGKIHEMLTRTADYYDDELESSLQNLTTLLEPVLIIMVGGI
ncbi:MAG: type II secretion system F family protein, partial [Candidatus Omnitrophica bacterium]|nr:type II secretion system F family protein [Candidatus Omnitrophota bacterium]